MAPLATTPELETYTGLTFDQVRSDMALEQVSAAVRNYIRWHLSPSVTETVVVDGSGAVVLKLPTLYLTALNSLTEDAEVLDVDDVEWTVAGYLKRSYAWTGKLRGVSAGITHGYSTVPLEVREIVMNAAARGLLTPAGGVVRDQEAVGDYSISNTYSQIGFNQAGGSALMEHEKTILDNYRIPNPA